MGHWNQPGYPRRHFTESATPILRGGLRLGLGLLLLVVSHSGLAQAQWVTDIEAAMFVNSNIGDATAGPDVHSVTGLTEAVSTGPFFELRPGTNLMLKGEARYTEFNRYTALDGDSLAAKVRLEQKFGLGRQAPRAYLAASDSRLSVRDDLRSGWQQTLALGGRSLFGERMALHAEMGWDRRTGTAVPEVRAGLPSDVFDQSGRRWTIGGDYTLTGALLLQIESTVRRGDADYIETTTLADTFEGATAVARDPAFGPSVFVEKIQVHALFLDTRLSWAVGEHTSVNFGFRRQWTVDTTGTLYTRSITAITYQYRFD